MKFRWTEKELKETTLLRLIFAVLEERKTDLDPYGSLYKKLCEAENLIEKMEKEEYQKLCEKIPCLKTVGENNGGAKGER